MTNIKVESDASSDKNISFSSQEMTYLLIALQENRKKIINNLETADGAHEDLLMIDWLIKKIDE